MIEEYLMKQGKVIAPQLKWTVNNYVGVDATGTVYEEGGSPGYINSDAKTLYPNYMFWIRSPKGSKNWDTAKAVAYKLFKQLHKQRVNELVEVPELDTSYRVIFMQAMSTPIKIGVEDDVMTYSLNIQATIEEEL
ncbi:hypothetical protein ACEPPU_24100 [Priestia aryabhattai]|uniref:hypothetical protein n=1 Tax=Priestia aryabhattai TaxID=412384 RepID=UPI0035ABE319